MSAYLIIHAAISVALIAAAVALTITGHDANTVWGVVGGQLATLASQGAVAQAGGQKGGP